MNTAVDNRGTNEGPSRGRSENLKPDKKGRNPVTWCYLSLELTPRTRAKASLAGPSLVPRSVPHFPHSGVASTTPTNPEKDHT